MELKTTKRTICIEDIIAKIKKGQINCSGARNWSLRKITILVELLMQRAPLNLVYMNVDEEDKWTPMQDKLEAISNLYEFIIDSDLRLLGMKYRRDLEGISFEELPEGAKNRILDTLIDVVLIESTSTKEARDAFIEAIDLRII